jgi:hypothetical protein
MCPVAAFCLHCERRPSTSILGLCSRCHARDTIRPLYVRRRGWTPGWELHLRRLTQRARQHLPLFDDEPHTATSSGAQQ